MKARDLKAVGGAERNRRKASIVSKIGHELKVNPPAILAKTRRKKGARAAEKQRVAILLSKARAHA